MPSACSSAASLGISAVKKSSTKFTESKTLVLKFSRDEAKESEAPVTPDPVVPGCWRCCCSYVRVAAGSWDDCVSCCIFFFRSPSPAVSSF